MKVLPYIVDESNIVGGVRSGGRMTNKLEMPNIAICPFFSDKLLLNLLSIPVAGKGSDPVRKKLQNTSLL